jgi:hypothetical protein
MLMGAAAPAHATIEPILTLPDPAASFGAGSHPSITAKIQFQPSANDDVKNVTLSLAPGLLGDPTVAGDCTTAQLNAQPIHGCPAASKVGQGTVTLAAGGALPAEVFDMGPLQPGQAARLGLRVETGGLPVTIDDQTFEGPVTIRNNPDVGLDIDFSDLPQMVGALDIQITQMSLTLNGTVNGQDFTRIPDYCSPQATSTVTAFSWDDPSLKSDDDSFSAINCPALAYGPGLAASGVYERASGAFALKTTITQTSDQSSTKQAELTLPQQLFLRATELN